MMKPVIFAVAVVALFGLNVFGHQAFTLVSSEKLTVTEAQLAELQRQATVGKVDGANLRFGQREIRLVFTTGPEDDMLSYRVQGLRNPNIVTPGDVRITVWFVNTDDDMPHDLLFAHYMADLADAPDVAMSAGTQRVRSHANENAPFNAEKIVITSNEDGAYKYFCSVRGHAKAGMWGNILVGVEPGSGMQMPAKSDSMPGMDMSPKPSPSPADMSAMPGMNMPSKPTPTPADMSSMPGMNMSPTATPSPGGNTSNMPGMNMGGQQGMKMPMSSTVNIGDPMEREASGTSWNPDSSRMYAHMRRSGDGDAMMMIMGTVFLRYTNVGSSRDVSTAGKGGRSRVDAPSMFMFSESMMLGAKAQFGLRVMLSLDPIIERGYGYPLLYQSGEEYRDQPIHDRQHPHDLVSELAVTYSYKFDDKRSIYFYAGYPGEPALGPPMYLHRLSGMNNPDAPIGHHWQDATHITFGVLTAGYSFGKVKLEASAFNGTEPDSNRYNFDRPRINSFSGRLSFNPTKNLALQISHGYLENPERSEPDVHILRRTTASAIYNRAFDDEHNWATSVVWGQNYANGERANAFLAESNYDFAVNAVFTRFETVQKTGRDLVLPSKALQDKMFNTTKFSIGFIRDVVHNKGIDVGLGGMLTADFNPATLTPFYGGTRHAGWSLFMRLRPSKVH